MPVFHRAPVGGPGGRFVARLVLVATIGAVLPVGLAGTAVAADPAPAIEVRGTTFDAGDLAENQSVGAGASKPEQSARLHERQGERARAGLSLDGRQTATKREVPGRNEVDSVAEGLSSYAAMTGFGGNTWPAETVTAGIRSRMLAASTQIMAVHSTTSIVQLKAWEHPTFFGLPSQEFYWQPTVAVSLANDRYVAVLPSWDNPSMACAKGYLNVAVSKSADPGGSWTRFRIPITDAYMETVSIGVSDSKVSFSGNEWDLSSSFGDCIDGSFEGSRIRVVDWADLLDGGTLTVRDVSPTPRTNYYSWVAAANVPGTSAITSSNNIYLAGSRFVGEWGHLAFATITGSAKAGSATLSRNTDLSAAHSMRLLVGPPETIAAFPSGNGLMDERIVSAAYRGGRLWLSANDTCRVAVDAPWQACARVIELNTTPTVPTVLQDVVFTDIDRDTFHPVVGVARDGTTYFTMSGSPSTTKDPIDAYATYRALDDPLIGGSSEVVIREGENEVSSEFFWASLGSITPDTTNLQAVWASFPYLDTVNGPLGITSRLIGGQTGDPSGSFIVGNGSGWANGFGATLNLTQALNSPIQRVRWSAAPDTEDVGFGNRLVQGLEAPAGPRVDTSFDDPAIGGSGGVPSYTAYVQWQSEDGIWSAPVSTTIQLDHEPPSATTPKFRFATGTVGSTVPVRFSWTASDGQSGVNKVYISRLQRTPVSKQQIFTFPASTTLATQNLSLPGTYDWNISVEDMATNRFEANLPRTSIISVGGGSSALSYVKTWTTATSSNYLGGTSRYATAAGASVTYSFQGRAVGFVTSKGPTRGKAEVWVDGVKVTTLDLKSSTTRHRQLVWATSWDVLSTHTVRIRVLGTSGRPRVDLDAFVKF